MNKILAKASREKTKNQKKIDDAAKDSKLLEEAENFYLNGHYPEIAESRSRLAKNFRDVVLTEKNCLSYFIQFLETANALNLIKFWLDVENFRTAAEICHNPTPTIKTNNHYSPIITNDLPIRRRNNLTQSVSSEGSLSFISSTNEFDTLSTNSLSENNLDEVGEEDNLDADENESPFEQKSNASSTNSSNVDPHKDSAYESQHLSLTDDEKYQMNEKKRHHSAHTAAEPKTGISSHVQSMIIADAIRIYKKYLTTTSAHHIDIPVCILSNISVSLCGETVTVEETMLSTSSLPLNIFHEAQTYILELLEKEYLTAFLDSTFYCKYTIDVLTSDNLCLNDILYCESALFYFMEFLEQDNQHRYLEFWLTATNFKRQLEKEEAAVDKEQVQADALVLYEKYFSLQATTTTLNMSNAIRSSVEENICQEVGPSASCFDLPVAVIEYYLERKYLKEFLKSQLFCKYLTEMFNRIQEVKPAPPPASVPRKNLHRKTHSDCTADKAKHVKKSFMSCQNTLLAMESNKFGTLNHRALHTADNLQINSQLITNPDLLWQRNGGNSNGQLSFGRINALGRYERDFDMELVEEKGALASGGSLLRKAVKKLVHLPENEVQEEMAWQVAEMIIKDITDVTLKKNGNGCT